MASRRVISPYNARMPRIHAGWTGWQAGTMKLFTPAQARMELARLRPVLEELVVVRANVVELAAALAGGGASTGIGGLPEWKAAEARLDELLSELRQTGMELKSVAPLLLDFPADLDGTTVFLCWLEGESELGWYHRVDLGFAGRRRLR